jgi:uncharacterized OB-fold protein
MSAEVLRVAVYLPVRVIGGRRRSGPDEDEFTLAVAAAERLERGRPAGEFNEVHLFGAFPEPVRRTFGTAVGAPGAEIVRHPDTEAELRKLLSAAPRPKGSEASLLIAADSLAGLSNKGGTDRDSGAVALRFDAGAIPPSGKLTNEPAAGRDPELLRLGAPGSACLALSKFVPPVSEGGDALPPIRLETMAPGPTRVELNRVSEGAYIPRARYEESLPSRWRFAADRCGKCGGFTFPTRGFCRHCSRSKPLERVELPRDGGVIEALTTVHSGAQPTEFDWAVGAHGSYAVALVRLAPGVRATLQVAELPSPSPTIGDPIVTGLRRLYPMEGEWRYGRKVIGRLPTPSSPPSRPPGRGSRRTRASSRR